MSDELGFGSTSRGTGAGADPNADPNPQTPLTLVGPGSARRRGQLRTALRHFISSHKQNHLRRLFRAFHTMSTRTAEQRSASYAAFDVLSARSALDDIRREAGDSRRDSRVYDDKSKHLTKHDRPTEKLLAEAVTSNKFDQSSGYSENFEYLQSLVKSQAGRYVCMFATYPEYVLNACNSSSSTTRHELVVQLDAFRNALSQLTENELDGSNLAWTLKQLPETCGDRYADNNPEPTRSAAQQASSTRFFGYIDAGPCIAQVRRYSKDAAVWPPLWGIGKGSRLPGGTIDSVSQIFIRAFKNELFQQYFLISQRPENLDDFDFVPEEHRSSSPYSVLHVSFEKWLLWDSYLSNLFLHACISCRKDRTPELMESSPS